MALPDGLHDARKINQAIKLRAAGYKVAAIAEILDVTQEAVRLMTYDSESASNNRQIAEARRRRIEEAEREAQRQVVAERPHIVSFQNKRRAALLVAREMIAEGRNYDAVVNYFSQWVAEESIVCQDGR